MEIFRAVPRKGFVADRVHTRYHSSRLPGNVSYLADNVWELTRPSSLPSRRHAVYASPTPQLALEGASADLLTQAEYLPCRVIFNKPVLRIFQLSVRDARFHRDRRQLQNLANERLKNVPNLESKRALAPLFPPGVTSAELSAAMQSDAGLRALAEDLAAAVTMWSDPPNANEGEIIFELDNDLTYML